MGERRSTRPRVKHITRGHTGEHQDARIPGDQAPRAELLVALRENQRLLRELAYAYRMPRVSARAPAPLTGASVISCPHDVAKLLGEDMSTLCQEQLRVVLLDTKNHVLGCDLIYQGTIHSIAIRAAEVLRPAILVNAPAIIVVHNHPSGDPTPSTEDARATKHLMAAGDTVDIQVLDHVVLGSEGRYASLREHMLGRHCTETLAA